MCGTSVTYGYRDDALLGGEQDPAEQGEGVPGRLFGVDVPIGNGRVLRP